MPSAFEIYPIIQSLYTWFIITSGCHFLEMNKKVYYFLGFNKVFVIKRNIWSRPHEKQYHFVATMQLQILIQKVKKSGTADLFAKATDHALFFLKK